MGKLTKKQKIFADEYLDTGNGTQSALKAYDTDNPNVAHSIANENLRKPTVIEYLQNNAEEVASNMVKLALNAESESVQFQAGKDILDRSGFKPVDKSINLNMDMQISVDEELVREYEEKLRQKLNKE